MKTWTRATLALLAIATVGCAHGGAAAKNPTRVQADPVMRAMVSELERSRSQLALGDQGPPYFVAFAIKENRKATVAGKLGAVYLSDDTRNRLAWVDVRVGDYSFDSSEDLEADFAPEGVYDPSVLVPVDDDPAAIRHTLWLMTDTKYKTALAGYLKLKGQRVLEPDDPDRRPSFSKAPALTQVDPRLQLTIDRPRWEALVKRLSGLFKRDPAIFDGEVSIDFHVVTRWLVNSEGVRVRTVETMYAFHASAYTRASDGMLLDQSVDIYRRSEGDLPTDQALEKAVEAMISDLAALRAAPVLEPYTGPAILEEQATGVFFHEVLGHRLEGHRQDDDEEGRTFAEHLGQPILPSFLSVSDDPTQLDQGSLQLNGAYAVDDEGVQTQPVVLVDRGVLRGFLMSRRPVQGFKASNGHGRAQGVRRPVARMGNLIVTAHKTVPKASLKDRLLAEVRRQGKPFGLIIRGITGGSTNTSSYGYQAFKGEARMVYKVDAETGAESLVRGVEIVGTPLTALSKIMAASDTVGVFNGYCGAESGMVPVSTVAPATLFREIELQRTLQARSRPPILPPPGASQGGGQ